MAKLQHPHKAEIQALRQIVTAVDPAIAEGVKWNAPSFRTTEYFATTHLRSKIGVGLILHLGAKAHELPRGGLVIDDPGKLLEWLGRDRAMIEYAGMSQIESGKRALQSLIRQWIRHV
jgi:hypothetical protein